ncbi:MAG: N-6 DNA methylase [Thermodesulfobacteriota bacterium]
MLGGKITERTLYHPLMQILNENNASGISELRYNGEPDIVFEFLGEKWLLPVKIGQNNKILTNNLIQAERHRRESRINNCTLLFFPDSIRKTHPSEEAVERAVRNSECKIIVLSDLIQSEYISKFPEFLFELSTEIQVLKNQKQQKYFSLDFVVPILQTHLQDIMHSLKLQESQVMQVVADKSLFKSLGHIKADENQVVRFLAAYVFTSQILFLRLFQSALGKPQFIPPATRIKLRDAFNEILEINYEPIFSIDVLEAIPDAFIKDTYDLIHGLRIENIKYELPGRIFHELLPPEIRKMLAAFYTRPYAADILAGLSINDYNARIFDPACGSGTILVSAYKRKKQLAFDEHLLHKKFCEEDIHGADIMPFAVHLTVTNLASLDVATTINETRITEADSLKLFVGDKYTAGVRIGELFPSLVKGKKAKGGEHEFKLNEMDAVLMNPPFTKVERGIGKYILMNRFKDECGGEVGLWGHFIFLADNFLRPGGILGAVIPINVLRGRESAKVREFLFSEYTPLYILKLVNNYAFSEGAEYRDIIFIAQKKKPLDGHKVKFCLIKRDITKFLDKDIKSIITQIKTQEHLRSNELDINSETVADIRSRMDNLMWFIGISDFVGKDSITQFFPEILSNLRKFPNSYSKEGYRFAEGISKAILATRRLSDARVEKAFLFFDKEDKNNISARTHSGIHYSLEKDAFVPGLRTTVSLNNMDITSSLDYIACSSYKEFLRVKKACGFNGKVNWTVIQDALSKIKTNIAIARRINPFSPNIHLVSFFSPVYFHPGDQFKVILENDINTAKAICVLLNSILFFAQFFLLKEESTGRQVDIRGSDFDEMYLYPNSKLHITSLAKIFNRFSNVDFPCLAEQFDKNFFARYEEWWEREMDRGEKHLISVLNKSVSPSDVRIDFDLAVLEALGISVKRKELIKLYEIFVNEMIITRGLKKD